MRLALWTLLGLGLFGCSLLAPSREEISGQYGKPTSSGAGNSTASAGTGGTGGSTGGASSGMGGAGGGAGGAGGIVGSGGAAGNDAGSVSKPCVSPNYICFEAESGTVVAPMATASDSTASGGEYVVANQNETGSVKWTFQVTQPGVYVVWCRVLAVNDGTDSFYVSIDGGPPLEYDTSWLNGQSLFSPDWEWTMVDIGQNQMNQVVRTFQLTAGSHVLEFDGREMGSKVDRLIVTSDLSFTPS